MVWAEERVEEEDWGMGKVKGPTVTASDFCATLVAVAVLAGILYIVVKVLGYG